MKFIFTLCGSSKFTISKEPGHRCIKSIFHSFNFSTDHRPQLYEAANTGKHDQCICSWKSFIAYLPGIFGYFFHYFEIGWKCKTYFSSLFYMSIHENGSVVPIKVA